jgi:hypothetical protein
MTSPERSRLQKMCRRLALAPIGTCRSLHSCTFCAQYIRAGERYRDRGYGARAHEICFQAVNQEVNN